MQSNYIPCIVIHLVLFPGMLMAFLFARTFHLIEIIEVFENPIVSLVYVLSFLSTGYLILRLDVSKFKFKESYTASQYITRSILRSLFLCASTFAVLFALNVDPFTSPLMILIYLILSPRFSTLKKLVKSK